MLIDMHAHTGAISRCCQRTAEQIIQEAKDSGFDGLVITNHYQRSYYSIETYNDWIELYIQEINYCKNLGKKQGIKIFGGIEVTMEYDPRVHLLIYGADDKFIRRNRNLPDMTQKALYNVCHNNGCVLVNAHPFRNGCTIQDINYIDGLELNFHRHPAYFGSCRVEDVSKKACENGLIITAGCDYHGDTEHPCGGMYIPESVSTEKKLAEYLLSSKSFDILVDDPDSGEQYRKMFYAR